MFLGNFLVSALLFMLGAAISSFLLVVIHRLRYNKGGIISGRSYCPDCKNQLKTQHLIPVFSWLFLRGKCAFCKNTIPAQYFLIEVFGGLSFVTYFLKFNFLLDGNPTTLWTLIFFIILNSFFIAIFVYDLFYQEIPDRFSIPAIIIALIGNLALSRLPLNEMLIGAAIIFTFFFLQFFLSKGRALGGGDLRIGVLMGFLLGWKLGLLALFLSYLFGGIFASALLIQKRTKKSAKIAFGPFLLIGIYLTIHFGNDILNWYLSSLTF